MARRLIAFPALLLGGALGGCAEPGPPTLAAGSVEAAVPAVVWPDDPELVGDISCPGVELEPIAQASTCTAVLDGDRVTVDITVDDLGAVDGVVREPLFSVADAAGQLATRLAEDLGIAAPAIDCERAVTLARAGTEFGCTATRGDDPIDFVVRLLDADGRWSVRIR